MRARALQAFGNKKMASSSRSTQETADDFMQESSDEEDAAQAPTTVTLPRSMAAAHGDTDANMSREMKKVLTNQAKKQVNVRSLVRMQLDTVLLFNFMTYVR